MARNRNSFVRIAALLMLSVSLAACSGDKGPKGDTGDTGPAGPSGPSGTDLDRAMAFQLTQST